MSSVVYDVGDVEEEKLDSRSAKANNALIFDRLSIVTITIEPLNTQSRPFHIGRQSNHGKVWPSRRLLRRQRTRLVSSTLRRPLQGGSTQDMH